MSDVRLPHVPLFVVALSGLAAIGLVIFTAREGIADRPVPEIHYAPAENLEPVDVALLDSATRAIDMAAYTLTDAPVIDALARAATRGVRVRILFDREQLDARPETDPLIHLQELPGVAVRVKRSQIDMHLKAYQVDSRVLRSGSANFSGSGLTLQDNDLIVMRSPSLAAAFAVEFEIIWDKGAPQ